eukprot:9321517-Pyramimonas_sp.AAC.1
MFDVAALGMQRGKVIYIWNNNVVPSNTQCNDEVPAYHVRETSATTCHELSLCSKVSGTPSRDIMGCELCWGI